MISFQWPIKLKKRQVSQAGALGESSEWIPFSNNFPPTQSTRLATVGRCLRLYSDFLCQTPLEKKGGGSHYLIDLLKKPNRWQSQKNFFESLVFELLLNGNFHARVRYDSTGKVTALLPYRAGMIYAHATRGEYGDPVSLQDGGYYFRDYKGRVLMPDDIFHLRDSMFNTSDQLNGLSRVYLYELSFRSGYSIQAVQGAISDSGLKPPHLLNYPESTPKENLKSVKNVVAQFFSTGQSSKAGNVLSLPVGYELKNLMIQNPDRTMEFLASKSDLDIARIFSVPIELLNRADAKAGSAGSNHLKEAHRFFIRTTLKSFLRNIADRFSDLAMDGTEFYFKTDALRASDLREQAQFIKQLIDSEVIKPSKALDWLGGDDA